MLQKGFWFSRSWLPLTSKGTKALSKCPWIQSLVEGKTPAFLDSCAVPPFKARSAFLSENREQGFNGTVEHLPLCTGKYRWVSPSVMSKLCPWRNASVGNGPILELLYPEFPLSLVLPLAVHCGNVQRGELVGPTDIPKRMSSRALTYLILIPTKWHLSPRDGLLHNPIWKLFWNWIANCYEPWHVYSKQFFRPLGQCL